jgi:hypothetical protein
MKFHLYLFALILLIVCQGKAVGLQLSAPLGGDDTLHCDAYVSKPLGAPPDTKDFLTWLRTASAFATSRHSEVNTGFPYGFVDIGLDGQNYRLAAQPQADLLLGGTFVSRAGTTTTTLKIKVESLAFVHDAHEDEESAVASVARFEIVQGREKMRVEGAVFCSVYELHDFHKELCLQQKAKNKPFCEALAKALSHPPR